MTATLTEPVGTATTGNVDAWVAAQATYSRRAPRSHREAFANRADATAAMHQAHADTDRFHNVTTTRIGDTPTYWVCDEVGHRQLVSFCTAHELAFAELDRVGPLVARVYNSEEIAINHDGRQSRLIPWTNATAAAHNVPAPMSCVDAANNKRIARIVVRTGK